MQVVVTNLKGGVGKSTLAACLAEAWPASIVDHDPQGTIRINARHTGRFLPLEEGAKPPLPVIIHDTPPYLSTEVASLAKEADLILVPAKLSYPDLLALGALSSQLRTRKITHKAIVVPNEVRPLNRRINKEVLSLIAKEFPHLKVAETHLPNWIGFARVLAKPLPERERERVKELICELIDFEKKAKCTQT